MPQSSHLSRQPDRHASDESSEALTARVLDGVLADAGDLVVRYDLHLRRVWANRRFEQLTSLIPPQRARMPRLKPPPAVVLRFKGR